MARPGHAPRPPQPPALPRTSHAVGGRPTPPAGTGSRPAATAEQIRVLAYQKWEAAGSPAGDGVPFWLDAERELAAG